MTTRIIFLLLGLSASLKAAPDGWLNLLNVQETAKEYQLSLKHLSLNLGTASGYTHLREDLSRLQDLLGVFIESADTRPTPSEKVLFLAFDKVRTQATLFRKNFRKAHASAKREALERDFLSTFILYAKLDWYMPEESELGEVSPLEPSLPPIELSETFSYSTGQFIATENEYKAVTERVRTECLNWRGRVASSTLGKVLISQCSAPERVSVEGGRAGVRMTGQMTIQFDTLRGVEAPVGVSLPISVPTGQMNPTVTELDQVRGQAARACSNWADKVKSISKGLFLFIQCGATRVTEGSDHRIWVTVKASASATWKKNPQKPRELSQEFKATTGLFNPTPADIEKATDAASNLCQTWSADLTTGSHAIPVLLSCLGPEVVFQDKVDVKFYGKAWMLMP